MSQPHRPPATEDAPIPAGLSEFLAAACALHRAALPAGIARRAGIGCMVIEGDLRSAPTDAGFAPDLVLRPLRETGWRSCTEFRDTRGQRLSVEVVADGPGVPPPEPRRAAHRVQALQRVGAADIRLAAGAPLPGDACEVAPGTLSGADGRPDLVVLSTLLDALEAARIGPGPRPRLRRMHAAPEAASGPCRLAVRAWSGAAPDAATVSVRGQLRLAATGGILAVSETLYRP